MSLRRETWWFPGILHFPLLRAACSSQIHTFDAYHQSYLLCVEKFHFILRNLCSSNKNSLHRVSRCVLYRFARLRGSFSSLTKDIELNEASARPGLPIELEVQNELLSLKPLYHATALIKSRPTCLKQLTSTHGTAKRIMLFAEELSRLFTLALLFYRTCNRRSLSSIWNLLSYTTICVSTTVLCS